MPQHEVRIQETIAAPPERVFAFLAEHENFARLFGGRCVRVKDGEGEVNGLGSVRRIGPGPLSFDETIVTYEPSRKLEYAITRGSPLKNHRGTLDLQPVNGGTRLDYVIRFDGKLPLVGAVVAKALATAWRLNAPKQLAQIARG